MGDECAPRQANIEGQTLVLDVNSLSYRCTLVMGSGSGSFANPSVSNPLHPPAAAGPTTRPR